MGHCVEAKSHGSLKISGGGCVANNLTLSAPYNSSRSYVDEKYFDQIELDAFLLDFAPWRFAIHDQCWKILLHRVSCYGDAREIAKLRGVYLSPRETPEGRIATRLASDFANTFGFLVMITFREKDGTSPAQSTCLHK